MSSSCTSAEYSATLFEYGMYLGVYLQDILYGIELVLYCRTMKVFLARRKQPHKSDKFYAAFSTAMLILITVWVASLSMLGQEMWLLHRDYPGGPMAYHKANSSALYIVVGRFSLAILQQMTDALMIYRCRIVWGSRRVIVVPSIVWLANFGLGMSLDWATSLPGATFFSGLAAKLGLAYYSSSTFLNVALTSMICYRLLRHARTVKNYLGGRHASPYIAIVTLIVESVLPFTLSSVAFLVSYGLGSQSTVVFSFVHPLVMCVAPQMLILHVAMAEAWQKHGSLFPESIIRIPPDNGDTLDSLRLNGGGTIADVEASPDAPQKPDHFNDEV